MVTVYFHSSNQIFFEDVLSRDEKKRQRKIKTDVNNTTLVGEENNNIETKVEENKSSEEVEKKTETKTSEKKTKSKAKTKKETK